MSETKIEITGPGAEEAEQELQALLREDFGAEGRRVAADPAEREPGRKIDPNTLALIAILLALPGTLDATANLAKRMELTTKVKRLVAWARKRGPSGPRIRLVSPKGRSLDLEHADSGDVVEALTEHQESEKTERKS